MAQRLARVPVPVLLLSVLALILGGVILGGAIGAFMILIVASLSAWLAYITWPQLRTVEKLMRVAPIVLLIGLAIVSGASHAVLF